MYSGLNRLQAVFGFFTTVAFCVAGLAAFTSFLSPTDSMSSSVALSNVQVIRGRPHYYSSKREEYAQIKFDLEADFTPLFNWNTKQIFVYVVAQYPPTLPPTSDENPQHLSEAVIWDTIISAPESDYSFAALKERFLPAPSKKSSTSSSRTKSKSKSKGSASVTNKAGKGKTTSKKSDPTNSAHIDGHDSFAVLSLKNQKPKYQVTDISGKIAERANVTLTVGWNIQPWVGALWWSPGSGAMFPRTKGTAGTSESFDFPALKGSTGTDEGARSKA